MMKRLLLFLMLLPVLAKGQIISTIAGTGLQGYSGDGGLAIDATFYYPEALWVDDTGNIYVLDKDNNALRVVNHATGTITTACHPLISPTGLCIDRHHNIFIADAFGVQRINAGSDTAVTVISAASVAGVCVDTLGNLYFTQSVQNRVIKVPAGTDSLIIIAGNGSAGHSGDGGLAIDATLNYPWGITLNRDGDLIFSERQSSTVRKVSMLSGIIWTIAGTGVLGNSGDGGPATSAEMTDPKGIFVDVNDNVFIADENIGLIRMVDGGSGIIYTTAGGGHSGLGNGGLAIEGELSEPVSVFLDGSGSLLIADADGQMVRKVTNAANVSVSKLQHAQPQIILYPNPATTSVSLFSPEAITTVSITNILGQVVYTQEFNTPHVEVDVACLQAGVYVVKINGADARSLVKR